MDKVKASNMPEQHDQQKQQGSRGDQQQKHFTPDQISFYDETLKRQIEGSYRTDGKAVHVSCVEYGIKSAPYGSLGTFIDQDGLDLLAQKLLNELARDADGGKKDVRQQKTDQQRQQPEPMQRPVQGEAAARGRGLRAV